MKKRGHRMAWRAKVLCLIGCALMVTSCLRANKVDEKRYFESPEKAVPILSQLLSDNAFSLLADYYDLTGSDVKRGDLESGRFFINAEKPPVAHPAGFWRYRHPFPPGFQFASVRSTDRGGVHLVFVEISIDQGVDSPVQRGQAVFFMRKTSDGWQVLPEKPSSADAFELPVIE